MRPKSQAADVVASAGIALAGLGAIVATSPSSPALSASADTPPPTVIPSADPDHDGLTNAREAAIGTNPNVADTDHDGLTDGHEVHGVEYRTTTEITSWGVVIKINPLKADTDGDGLTDGQEHTRYWVTVDRKGGILGYRTWRVSSNPRVNDTDRDGLSDRAERRQHLDPWDANTDGWFHSGPVVGHLRRTLHEPGVIDSKDRFPLNPRKA